ncbi:MAG: hypothetical protein ACXW1U_14250 [Methylobacter sp.]
MTVNKKKTGSALQANDIPALEDPRTSLSAAALKQAVLDHLNDLMALEEEQA